MTISSITSKVIYVGTGSTAAAAKVFAYPFKILAEGDLTVSDYDIATSVATVKVLTTDYVISGVGDSAGGNVTLTGSYTNLPTSSKLVVQRVVDLTQETDYVENDAFPAETHERALDKLTMGLQQIQEQIDRAILADVAQVSTNVTFADFSNQRAAATSSANVAIAQATAATSSATVAVSAASNYRFIRVTLVDPADIYSVTPAICLLQSLNAAITIQNITVTCDANPATQLSGNLLYANAFIGTASPVAIDKINTTSGVLYDTSISNASVAAGKCIYLQFDAQPTASLTQVNVNMRYTYD